MSELQTRRLTASDRKLARKMFAMMAELFGEETAPLRDAYIDELLSRDGFWAIAAFTANEIVGGLTAHTLPMTRAEPSELLIYDLAVSRDHQRQGIGRQLITTLCAAAAAAGIQNIFVAADNKDAAALRFYSALGAAPAPVTHFTFPLAESASPKPPAT
jgi:aminoglycoside 3-N-acetyltransferase I